MREETTWLHPLETCKASMHLKIHCCLGVWAGKVPILLNWKNTFQSHATEHWLQRAHSNRKAMALFSFGDTWVGITAIFARAAVFSYFLWAMDTELLSFLFPMPFGLGLLTSTLLCATIPCLQVHHMELHVTSGLVPTAQIFGHWHL